MCVCVCVCVYVWLDSLSRRSLSRSLTRSISAYHVQCVYISSSTPLLPHRSASTVVRIKSRELILKLCIERPQRQRHNLIPNRNTISHATSKHAVRFIHTSYTYKYRVSEREREREGERGRERKRGRRHEKVRTRA